MVKWQTWIYLFEPFISQDLILNSLLSLLLILLYISFEDLLSDHNSNFHLISILMLNNAWIVREKLHVDDFWVKGTFETAQRWSLEKEKVDSI